MELTKEKAQQSLPEAGLLEVISSIVIEGLFRDKPKSEITVGDLVTKGESEILRIYRVGRKTLNEIKVELAERGLHLGMELPKEPTPELIRFEHEFSIHEGPTREEITNKVLEFFAKRSWSIHGYSNKEVSLLWHIQDESGVLQAEYPTILAENTAEELAQQLLCLDERCVHEHRSPNVIDFSAFNKTQAQKTWEKVLYDLDTRSGTLTVSGEKIKPLVGGE